MQRFVALWIVHACVETIDIPHNMFLVAHGQPLVHINRKCTHKMLVEHMHARNKP